MIATPTAAGGAIFPKKKQNTNPPKQADRVMNNLLKNSLIVLLSPYENLLLFEKFLLLI